ncbi:MAG: hypothetical protein IJH00_01115 [Erysipelotrichaceae bacterium]|nr:hypothetical protein [Erysipelotrichaceae bacterium]
MKKFLKLYSTEVVFAFVSLLFIILTGTEILRPMNITAIFLQNSYIFILATGMAICMTSKENIDISIGSFVCFICAMGGVFMAVTKLSTPVSIILLFILGILWGLLSGYLIAYLKIPAWVTTLSGYLAFRGLGVALINTFSSTGSIVGINESFLKLFSGKIFASNIDSFGPGSLMFCLILAILGILYKFYSLRKEGSRINRSVMIGCILAFIVMSLIGVSFGLTGGVPVSFVWMFIVVAITAIWIERSAEGRRLIMLGANPENARIAGVNVRKAMLMTYVFMAVCATLTGCIVLARFHASSSYAGVNFEMDTIAACAVGGVSLYGGKQKIFKAILGAALIGIINLGLSLIGVDMNWQWIIKGIIIVISVSFDMYLKKDRYE